LSLRRRNKEVSILRRLLLCAFALSGLWLAVQTSADAATPYHVIVNREVKGGRISRVALSSIFLRQAPRWADGSPIVPVDQSVQSEVRRSFSGDILSQGVVEVQIYWQRRMARGMTPPPVKASDEEVVRFVASNPGAIGYVTAATPLPESVRLVELTD
jgi:ABC-type phosphate transport system substrate-binding protein